MKTNPTCISFLNSKCSSHNQYQFQMPWYFSFVTVVSNGWTWMLSLLLCSHTYSGRLRLCVCATYKDKLKVMYIMLWRLWHKFTVRSFTLCMMITSVKLHTSYQLGWPWLFFRSEQSLKKSWHHFLFPFWLWVVWTFAVLVNFVVYSFLVLYKWLCKLCIWNFILEVFLPLGFPTLDFVSFLSSNTGFVCLFVFDYFSC